MSCAVAHGQTSPLAIAVSGKPSAFCSPCGACRQFLAEFNPKLEVVLTQEGTLHIMKLDTLLPHKFQLEEV